VLNDPVGEQLAGWGTVALVETRGRQSGRPVRAAIGYVEEPDGSLLVAAGDPNADWARNLLTDARCTVTIAGLRGDRRAEELDGRERSDAIARLILRYGTPAEGLGRGPVFRLRPAAPAAPGSAAQGSPA